MKILVICTDYPTESSFSMQYVHNRNLSYIKNGINVEVLSFKASCNYTKDGISVRTLSYITENIDRYKGSLLIAHAPNIRNHFIFIKKFGSYFRKMIFVFHGHEIVPITKVYPKDYDFIKKNALKSLIRKVYDKYKISAWKKYFKGKGRDVVLVFVSNSLKKDFFKYSGLKGDDISNQIFIINNGINEVFEKIDFDNKAEKKYDYITIRSNLDSSVYCIDLIREAALKNIEKKFLVIGKGSYFTHFPLPQNITLINHTINPKEMIDYINASEVALMPTRRDSQGVMSCELATMGIPLITSDIDVCHEMFDTFDNVITVSESDISNRLKEIKAESSGGKNRKFFMENTVEREIQLIKRICNEY